LVFSLQGVPRYFHHIGKHFLLNIALLSAPLTPPVLPGSHYPTVNGSMWTIGYEFRCYLLVAVFGLFGFVRKPGYWLAATVLFTAAFLLPHGYISWSGHYAFYGEPDQVFRLLSAYFVGGCFYLFREQIPFQRWLAWMALATLVASRWGLFELSLICCGGYLMFYAARFVQVPQSFRKIPDISYGIYLYGWPVEALWIWYHHGSPWVAFVASTVICIVLGSLSW
jgi:peptidoglycan/LPS O-acetylase OafA/YrhL